MCTPISVWEGKDGINGKNAKDYTKYIKSFGCAAYVHRKIRKKLGLRGFKAVLLGVDSIKKGYRLLVL